MCRARSKIPTLHKPNVSNTLFIRLLLEALHFSGAARFAQPRYGGCGAILMLHRVVEKMPGGFSPNSGLMVTANFLDRLLAVLKTAGFEFVSLDDFQQRLVAENAPPDQNRFLTITLDDGYRDNLENAVPIFRKHQIPYTIYIAPGLVDGRASLWWENLEQMLSGRDLINIDHPSGRREIDLKTKAQKYQAFAQLHDFFAAELEEEEQRRVMTGLCWLYGVDAEAHRARSIMNWDEIANLCSDPLCTIGAHTIHHYSIARLDEESARFELEESARLIELETGKRPTHFAFPYGHKGAAGPRDFELAARTGFETAVTTRHGVCHAEHGKHLHALPRISVNGNFQRLRHVKTLLSGLPTLLHNRGAKLNVS